jgi:HSP20 family molecular chaperone IbpA
MTNVIVQKVDSQNADSGKIEETGGVALALKALQDTVERVRQKAFELFERRGQNPGNELNDWIQAERDLFWVPPAELAETDKEVEITVAVPGFDPKEVQVTAQRGEIVIQGSHEKRTEKKQKGVFYTEFDEKNLYRRFEIAQPFDLDHVTANVQNGMLTVKAPKIVPLANKMAA